MLEEEENRLGALKFIDERKIDLIQDINTQEDLNFFIELLDIYIKDLPLSIARIKNSVTAQDKNQVRFYAHKLKGSSLTFGIKYISEICVKLEDAVKEDITSQTTASFVEELVAKFELIIKELETLKEKYAHMSF